MAQNKDVEIKYEERNILKVDGMIGSNTLKELEGYLLEVDRDKFDDTTWTSGISRTAQPIKLDNCPHCCGSVGVDGYCKYCGSLVYFMNS